ncbi:MAG: SDR family oxidoreductase [Alphaproteobacteria bacterium]|nr:SDR family oxidoreductase [Alphaproteobacteria bacterium]
MAPRLDGRVVVVTGGTQGVGEAVARHAAQCGAVGVVLTGRNQDKGRAVANAIGKGAHFVAADLAVPDDCHGIVKAALDRYGRIDGLVNAAGITDRGTIDDTSLALWDRMFAINTRAPFLLIQDAVRAMKSQGDKGRRGGSIVNIITMSSHGGQPFITAYCASKGALAVLTKNVAHAVRRDRIRVNGINIGWTDTPNEHLVQQSMGGGADWLVAAEARQPFGRLVKPIDVARLSVYLLSDQSAPMTGSIIDYDQNVMGAYD